MTSADPVIQIEEAVAALHNGQVIAIPTDTVYGLAASLEHPAAIEALFAIKGRAATKAIPVLVDDVARVQEYALDVPPGALELAAAFWPGAMTRVVQASGNVPHAIHQGSGTVGLRMPDSDIALAVISAAGGGLAVTSANLSGEPEARSAGEVYAALGDRVGVVVDGGPSPGGKPSTVVDLTGRAIRILRQGAITEDEIRRVISS